MVGPTPTPTRNGRRRPKSTFVAAVALSIEAQKNVKHATLSKTNNDNNTFATTAASVCLRQRRGLSEMAWLFVVKGSWTDRQIWTKRVVVGSEGWRFSELLNLQCQVNTGGASARIDFGAVERGLFSSL